MASDTLNDVKVAILVTDGFEQVEMTEPRDALDSEGAETRLVSPGEGEVKAWDLTDWGDTFPVDILLGSARPEDFDALLLPGGVINPDTLRTLPDAVAFVEAFFEAGKPVASICHGPWTLIEAGAGAEWVDQEVVVDRGLVTSRKPEDIPAFNREMIQLFAAARGQSQQAAG
jgi:protease I